MGDPTTPPVDNKLRQAFNDYTDWLALRGMKGNPELDKGDVGLQWIDKYRKENPTTPLTRDSIIPIQNEFSKYRDWSLAEIKAGRGAFAPGANADNYMKSLSIVDGIPGSRTTSYKFPDSYMTTFEKGKPTITVDKGFATTNKP